jgi:hypothetical protein
MTHHEGHEDHEEEGSPDFVSLVISFENCVMQKPGVDIRFLPLDKEGCRKG